MDGETFAFPLGLVVRVLSPRHCVWRDLDGKLLGYGRVENITLEGSSHFDDTIPTLQGAAQ